MAKGVTKPGKRAVPKVRQASPASPGSPHPSPPPHGGDGLG